MTKSTSPGPSPKYNFGFTLQLSSQFHHSNIKLCEQQRALYVPPTPLSHWTKSSARTSFSHCWAIYECIMNSRKRWEGSEMATSIISSRNKLVLSYSRCSLTKYMICCSLLFSVTVLLVRLNSKKDKKAVHLVAMGKGLPFLKNLHVRTNFGVKVLGYNSLIGGCCWGCI